MALYATNAFAIVAPIDRKERVKYYLMQCIERMMNLLEGYDDNAFIYEKGSIMLAPMSNFLEYKFHPFLHFEIS